MNHLTRVLQQRILELEAKAAQAQPDHWRLAFHLMPPTGWLNDPNGLCQKDGIYHVFYQYCPYDPKGGLIQWGHCTSSDWLHWRDEGVALYPDSPWDCHGVYSGSGWVENGELHLFFTGNVKLDGPHDYIHSGRGSATLKVISADGIRMGAKRVAVPQSDYPASCTNHVRDPKVWRADGAYWMVLGARLKNDAGAVLLYRSSDLENWTLHSELTSEAPFGYMWECPDYFVLPDENGRPVYILSCSPQGIGRGRYRCQNVHSAGYFILPQDITRYPSGPTADLGAASYREWDQGFDFYAQQTFRDESGRRLMLAWASVPDSAAEYTNPTIERGWQHALSVPRELTIQSGAVVQQPAAELTGLRGEVLWQADQPADSGTDVCCTAHAETADIEVLDIVGDGTLSIGNIQIAWTAGVLELRFGQTDRLSGLSAVLSDAQGEKAAPAPCGCGRSVRRLQVPAVTHLRVLVDTSMIELFVNHGQAAMTTRWYPEAGGSDLNLSARCAGTAAYTMRAIAVTRAR